MLVSSFRELSSFDLRALCTGESPNLIRRAAPAPDDLIPSASSPVQQLFEARLFLAWAKISLLLRQATYFPQRSFITATRPATDSLTIVVSHRQAVFPLMQSCLHVLGDGRYFGLNGVRPRPAAERLRLPPGDPQRG